MAKDNPRDRVNVIELVDKMVANLNKQCEKHEIPKYYKLVIKDGIKSDPKEHTFKTLLFTVADLNSMERLTLFSLDYSFKNPAYVLTLPYKRELYTEFLSSCVDVFAINLEANVRHNKAAEMEEASKNTTAQSSLDAMLYPTTPEDAYPKTEE